MRTAVRASRLAFPPRLSGPARAGSLQRMGTCPDAIKRLVDRFSQQSDTIRSPDYNETLIRIDFINPLMKELGWDMDNSAGYAERYRDVVHEDRVKVAGQTKAPEYSFRIGNARKFLPQ